MLVGLLVAVGLLLAIELGRFVFGVILGVRRGRARLQVAQERLRTLSEEKLIRLMRTPSDPASQLALAELMSRGVEVRPTREELFAMLVSGDPRICGDAMTNLMLFYPEIRLPQNSSNRDAPDLWQARIESMRRSGEGRES